MTDEHEPHHERDTTLAFAHALSTSIDPVESGSRAGETIATALGSPPDLVIGFVTPPFAQRVGMIADAIRDRCAPTHLMLVTSAAVMCADQEADSAPAVALLGATLPGVHIHPYWAEHLNANDPPQERAQKIAHTINATESMACSFFIADPFSVPLVNLVPTLSESRVQYSDEHGTTHKIGTIFGGLASGATTPGHNTLFLDGQIRNYGGMGITLSGDLQVDTIVSQGCRPFGKPMVITRARGNLILELGGQPAVDAVREQLATLSDDDRKLLSEGLLIGRVINEAKAHFGRADFLIRNLMGGDEQSGAIAVADLVSAGQTIQLHLHDAQTAREDLALLLDAQRLYNRPKGALVVSCTGRTRKFFGTPAHDARAIRHAFDQTPDGATRAKSGHQVDSGENAIPLAGFFAAGEIGPIGGHIFHHGHTAIAALFREPETIDLT